MAAAAAADPNPIRPLFPPEPELSLPEWLAKIQTIWCEFACLCDLLRANAIGGNPGNLPLNKLYPNAAKCKECGQLLNDLLRRGGDRTTQEKLTLTIEKFNEVLKLLKQEHPIPDDLLLMTDLQIDVLLQYHPSLLKSILEASARHGREQHLLSRICARPIFNDPGRVTKNTFYLALVKGYCSGGFLEKAEGFIDLFEPWPTTEKKEAIWIFWEAKAKKGHVSIKSIPEEAFWRHRWTDFWGAFFLNCSVEDLEELAQNTRFLNMLPHDVKVAFVERARLLAQIPIAVLVFTCQSIGNFSEETHDMGLFVKVLESVCAQPLERIDLAHLQKLCNTLHKIHNNFDKTKPNHPDPLEKINAKIRKASAERLTTTWALVCQHLLELYSSRSDPNWRTTLLSMLNQNMLIHNVQKYFTREERTNTHDAIEGFPWDKHPDLAALRESLRLTPKS